MTPFAEEPLRVGLLVIGRKRPGFDADWGRQVTAAAWDALQTMALRAVRPAEPAVDDTTLRRAITEFQRVSCATLVVLQPTMGDGRLAPILAQSWDGPLVIWATPERPDADRVSACSLVGAHLFASTLRQMQRSFEIVYGPCDDQATRRQVSTAVRLTAAAARIRGTKVGLVGDHAPGFINMHADPIAIGRQLGAQLQRSSVAEFQARADSCDAARVERDVRAVLDMKLLMAGDLDQSDLVPNSRYYLAMSDLMAEEQLDALALRCWPELPSLGHWPYLAMMRMTEEGQAVALEGDVDGAILGLLGRLVGIGVGYISDWLEHDARRITLWHPGHAPREMCAPETLCLGRHFNNAKPLVLNAQLRAGQTITLARLWRCDDRYWLTAFDAHTAAPQRPLLGTCGLAVVESGPTVPERFDRLCHAGMPHHLTIFQGNHVELLRRLSRLIGLKWLDAG